MENLAPHIFRKRLIIEGTTEINLTEQIIRDYLKALTYMLGMIPLTEPVMHRSEKYGWAGWIHWETSGCHIYAWNAPDLFFSVDIYTCKNFDAKVALYFTEDFFGSLRIVSRSV